MSKPKTKGDSIVIEIKRENKELKNCGAVFKELVAEYTENGSLHGIKYAGDRKRHWFERFAVLQ